MLQLIHLQFQREVLFLFSHCVWPQRKSIVTGAVEPTDEECEWQSDHEEEELAVSMSIYS